MVRTNFFKIIPYEGDGRWIVAERVFCHPFWGWEIISVSERAATVSESP